ncbi:hypothetical protein BBJ28_00009152 [Nothophytophthora sp. Chile5]|nr:hypothetical protein BBJ28_00009152 [Nothophytophthora sp. Chile5]
MLSVLCARSSLLRRPVAAAFRASSFSSTSSSKGFVRRSWESYATLLETHPLSTKIVTGGVIAGVGDVSCQLFIEADDNGEFDVKRAAIFTFLGGVLISPVLHVWYGFVGKLVPGVSSRAIVKRLALDQLVFAPTFLCVFFSSLLTLEGHLDQLPEKLRADWWPATKANWAVWVPAQIVNFRFVPGSLQVLFANVVGLAWNAYLSYISHLEAPSSRLEAAASEPNAATTTAAAPAEL